MNLHSILHGRCAFCYFHLAFLERLCDSVRPYGDVNVRPTGGLVEYGGQRCLADRAVRERRPCVAVALISWKWQK